MSAAGNANTSSQTSQWLTTVAGVMTVGASDSNGVGASFSNFGSWVHLAAPGVAVMSTYHDPTDPDTTHMYVGLLDGTSMSTPHAVGVAALLESYNPSLTRTQKFDLMVNNTTPFAPANTKVLGSGILNARLALAAAPSPVGVAYPPLSPARLLALAAAPNPFRDASHLLLRAPGGSVVHLQVMDAQGRLIRTWRATVPAEGALRLRWDGLDTAGRRARAGLYLAIASAGSDRAVARLVRLQ